MKRKGKMCDTSESVGFDALLETQSKRVYIQHLMKKNEDEYSSRVVYKRSHCSHFQRLQNIPRHI